MDEDYENPGNYFKLDKEFQGCESCSLLELYSIFKDKYTKKIFEESEINPIVAKTKQYCEMFNKYGFPETSEKISAKALEVRKTLGDKNSPFTPVEKVQLIDLLPQRAEEAFSLIPSLQER